MNGTPPRPIRVLVCDDQALVRTGYATIFSAQPDMEIVGEAANGHEAVRIAREQRPDVVVMDIRMPLLDGIQATRQLAGPDVQEPPKVLVVTTFNVDAYVYQALKAGASGFLLKDSPTAELVAGVRTVAAGDALIAPRRHPPPDRPLRRTPPPRERRTRRGRRGPDPA
ncbi:hypothetical protein GCM10020229_09900 [Kitasatospora albolonga]